MYHTSQPLSRLAIGVSVGVAALAITLAAATPAAVMAQALMTHALPVEYVIVKFKPEVSSGAVDWLMDDCRTELDMDAPAQNLFRLRIVDSVQSADETVACFKAQPDMVEWAQPDPLITENNAGQVEDSDMTLILAAEGTCQTEAETTRLTDLNGDGCVDAIDVDLYAYVLTRPTAVATPAATNGGLVVAPPVKNQCQIFHDIMIIAARLDILDGAFKPIEAVTTIGSLGVSTIAQKLVKEGGEKVTKEKLKEVMADLVKDFLKDKALDKVKDLLGDPFDPGAACQALAQCETIVNGNNVGKLASYNAIGNEMAKCVWRAPEATYKKLGLRHRLGLIDFSDEP